MNDITLASLKFNPDGRRLSGPSKTEILRPKVSELLRLLVTRYPAVATKQECLDELWPDTHVEKRALAQVVVELRKSLESVGGSREWVENIPKGGYRLTERFLETGFHPKQTALKKTAVTVVSPPGEKTMGRRAMGTGILLGLCVILFLVFQTKGPSAIADDIGRVAILPLVGDVEGKNAWLQFSFPELLTEALAKSMHVEMVDFSNVYQATQRRIDQNPDPSQANFSEIRTDLGVQTLIQIRLRNQQDLLEFTILADRDGTTREFSFMTTDPTATIPTVAGRIMDLIGLESPPEDVFGNPYLNETFGKGYTYVLQGEHKQAQPYLQVCYDQNPSFGRHIYYLAVGHIWLREYDQAEQLLTHKDRPDTPEWRFLTARFHFAKRQFDLCERLFQEIVSNEDAPRDLVSNAHTLLGVVMTRTERAHRGQDHFQKALDGFRETGFLSGYAKALNSSLKANQYLGLEVKESQWRELIEAAKLLRDRTIEGQALVGLGDTHYERQEWSKAYQAYERGLALRRRLSDSLGIGICLSGMGTTALRMGQFPEAESLLEEALAITIQNQDPYNQVNQYLNLGHLYVVQRRYDQARQQYGKALERSRESSDLTGEALALLGLCRIALHEKENQRLETLLAQADTMGVTNEPIRSAFTGFRAALAYRREDAQKALLLMEEAKTLVGENHWSPVAQEYLDLYKATVQSRSYQTLPCDLDPFKDPDL